ncbi:MAG TPA: GNAT family N-acetyltransferase [Bacillota bacterium]
MRRLPPSRVREILPDLPENCSALFLSTLETGTVLTDNINTPKLLAITCRTAPPPMYFLYGEPDQYIIIKRFLKRLHTNTDLVVPNDMQSRIGKFWPIRFSVPIVFFAAQEGWRPAPIQDRNPNGDAENTPEPHFRMLTLKDAPLLSKYFAHDSWLWEFMLTPEHLLEKGQVAAAFIGQEPVSVAVTLAYSKRYMEMGVVTRPEYRGHGLALDCCRLLGKEQYELSGRLPCWRTQAKNIGSIKVAKGLGLQETPSSGEYTFLSNYSHVGAYATVAP